MSVSTFDPLAHEARRVRYLAERDAFFARGDCASFREFSPGVLDFFRIFDATLDVAAEMNDLDASELRERIDHICQLMCWAGDREAERLRRAESIDA